jgi:hypothetical protein
MNVVASWRDREVRLLGKLVACLACGSRTTVSRRRCSVCNGDKFEISTFRKRAVARAATRSRGNVEQLNQFQAAAASVLIELSADRYHALPVFEADVEFIDNLVGEELTLAVRKLGQVGPEDPVEYCMKAGADAALRTRLFAKAGEGNESD